MFRFFDLFSAFLSALLMDIFYPTVNKRLP